MEPRGSGKVHEHHSKQSCIPTEQHRLPSKEQRPPRRHHGGVVGETSGVQLGNQSDPILLRFPLTNSAINLMTHDEAACMKRVTFDLSATGNIHSKHHWHLRAFKASVSCRVDRGDAKGDADTVGFMDSSLRVVQTVVPCPSTRN